MSVFRRFGRTLFAAVKAEASASTPASASAAATTSTVRTIQNPVEQFFEADRTQEDDKPVVYGRSWKACELRLKSWVDLHKLWYVLLKEKNMLMTQRQILYAQNPRFLNPERIPKRCSSHIQEWTEKTQAEPVVETEGNKGNTPPVNKSSESSTKQLLQPEGSSSNTAVQEGNNSPPKNTKAITTDETHSSVDKSARPMKKLILQSPKK